MNKTFGDHLVKSKEPGDGTYFTSVATEKVLPDTVKYVGVVFAANYCPPCKKFYEPLKAFYDEFRKDGSF